MSKHKNVTVIPEGHLQSGFMKSGFFDWPTRKFKCKDCGVEFRSVGAPERCHECAALRKKVVNNRYQKEWAKRKRIKNVTEASRNKA